MSIETVIIDGTGTGRGAKVDSEQRLLTRSITETDQLFKSQIGESFQLGTGIQTLTDDVETAVLFLRNNGDKDIAINKIILCSKAFTTSTEAMCTIKLYANPEDLTGGGVFSAGILNNNLGSSKELDATFLAATTGGAFTGGVFGGEALFRTEDLKSVETFWILPKGNSIGYTLTAGASNTSWDANLILECSLVS